LFGDRKYAALNAKLDLLENELAQKNKLMGKFEQIETENAALIERNRSFQSEINRLKHEIAELKLNQTVSLRLDQLKFDKMQKEVNFLDEKSMHLEKGEFS
jgi:hypothetical protein